MNKNKKIVFLDRDGVINYDTAYVSKKEEFKFIPGVFEACKHFLNLGYEIIIITNQSGIGRGYFNAMDFTILTNWMLKEFKKNNINILKVYHCPHSPEENCICRKPKIGMIKQAIRDFNINLQNSWLIGDKHSDIQTAINADIKNHILILSDYNKQKDNNISILANSLYDTIKLIKE